MNVKPNMVVNIIGSRLHSTTTLYLHIIFDNSRRIQIIKIEYPQSHNEQFGIHR